LYWQPPAAAKLAAAGLRLEDHPRPTVDLWPENEAALALFRRISTQWRIGPAGAVGLDYNVVYREMDRLRLGDEGQDEMMAAIRVIEAAALQAMNDEG
jgi:hypothetical protein